ncbi:MAG TPA: 2,3-bisphosphoglycerate-independent phosphoglycerate mutase [Candidatus Babeliales bacterium]|nr:2,3-bisphosphoglycerate-independent phosphoglycerate mutase [Candidatus Babeliales bacterium]
MKSMHPVALVILDGFGYSVKKRHNAIAHAHMPYFTQWWNLYPHAILQAAGEAVGLPEGFSGNSEVGHLTLGAGRIIPQPMKLWLQSIEDGSFEHNHEFIKQCKRLKEVGGSLHIMGLLSDAGVHAHEKQIHASIMLAINLEVKKIIIHPFLDGRDTPPRSAYIYLERLTHYIKQYNNGRVILGSLQGRYYAMDRDNNWERIEQSYRILTEKQNHLYDSWEKVLEYNYSHNITDEFIPPVQLNSDGYIHNGDGILLCNVRPDRARELTAAFIQEHFSHFIVKPLNLTFFMTPVAYSEDFSTAVLFPRKPLHNTLKDVLAAHSKTIFTIAETEKYAHVTYFFRGENEETVIGETRIMVNSIPAQNYIDNPRMCAEKITDEIIQSLCNNAADFYLINYANADMVGHSGDFNATVKAVEYLDVQLKRLYDVIVQKMNGTLYITADHGKAEDMYDDITQQVRTAHTSNPVPFVMIRKNVEGSLFTLPIAQLSHVAPFILDNMKIPVPDEMK